MATAGEGSDGRTLFRRPAFWVGFALVAAGALVFAARFFPLAFPQVGLDLEMDRTEALAAAEEVARERGWSPEDHRQAASFGEVDREVRTYLELEREVEDALGHLVREAGYHAYVWRVRHFREGEAREATTRFTPSGELDGFTVEVPEDDPGPALSADSARALAEAEAEALGIDPGPWELVESSTETRPSDRVDHALVYELPDADLGEADARLALAVAGDEVSEVRRFVRVPEAFSRAYAERRSANATLALAATLVFVLLFAVVGCGLGIFHMIRRGTLLAKPALAGGAVVAGLAGLGIINAIPLAWMGYDTAVSSRLFLLEQWGAALGALVVGGALLGAIFMAAEGLTRRARPEEPHLWGLWSRGVANTPDVLGRTVAGYLLAAVQLGFVVAFYLLALRRPGWWVPSEALVQPDFLAAYLPSLTAISGSFLAATWEEALFRAVPIAGAILLAHRFGAKGLLVGGALVLQAVVFAAAHANYPQEPAYARLVELVIPAAVWGLVYLRFGLLPVILAHFLYNLTFFSIPLFAAPVGLWLDRGLVVAAALLPLAVVLYRARDGFRDRVPEEARNAFVEDRLGERAEPREEAAEPPRPAPAHGEVAPGGAGVEEPSPGESGLEPPREREPEEVPAARGTVPPATADEGAREAAPAGGAGDGEGHRTRALRTLLVLGGAGGIAWLALTPLEPDVPSLELTAEEAEEAAWAELERRGVEVHPEGPWRAHPQVAGGLGRSHEFAWEEGGRDAYRQLLEAGHLRGPHWRVRFARFTGSSEERAEEFRVHVGPAGGVIRYRHTLPEEREGAELEEDEARERALGELRSAFGLEAEELEEVSAESERMPERLDWSFEFRRPGVHPLEDGESRARARVSGERVTDGYLDVHVPEAWERSREERERRSSILGILSAGALALLLGGTAVRGLTRWARARGEFRTDALLFAGGGTAAILLLTLWNGWPGMVANFDTALPWTHQAFGVVGLMVILGAFVVAILGLGGGFVTARLAERSPGEGDGDAGRSRAAARDVVLWGGLLGLALLGGLAVLREWVAGGGPVWLSYGAAGDRLPALAPGLGAVVGHFALALVVLALLASVRRVLDQGGEARGRLGVLMVLAGLVTAGTFSGDGVAAWLVAVVVGALALPAVAHLVRPVGPAAVPVAMAAFLGLPLVKEGIQGPYPGAGAGSLLAVLLLAAAALGWVRLLQREGRPDGVAEGEGGTPDPAARERPPGETLTGRTAAEPGP